MPDFNMGSMSLDHRKAPKPVWSGKKRSLLHDVSRESGWVKPLFDPPERAATLWLTAGEEIVTNVDFVGGF